MILSIIKKIAARVLPRHYIEAIRNCKILEFEYGHLRSSREWNCVDKNGDPIPWYTYPAIDYLNQLDFRKKSIFEWGSGNSSLFWSKRAESIVSIEDNEFWYQKIKSLKKENQKILLIIDKEEYINAITKQYIKYDIIIIDGLYRYECSKIATQYLEEGGMIILDNSDWYPKTAEVLRKADLIQVDFHGFGPIVGFTTTTSIFIHRKFNMKSLNENQPIHGIGNLVQYGDEA